MLKILIVDDDMLTRKGIRSLMPWAQHQMEVIGEAANGKEALLFLEHVSVDLVLVDLDMPVMDGLTFIQKASALYPDLNYVVLTVHMEFEYIQNVLRMGAIDYIAKTQFDRENFDQILDRIRSSIEKKNVSRHNTPSANWKESKILYPSIYALITLEAENDQPVFEFLKKNLIPYEKNCHELIPGVWIFTDTRLDFVFPDSFPNTMLLEISDVSDLTYGHLAKLLRSYVKNLFFYDYRPLKAINHKQVYELTEQKYIEDIQTLEKLKKEWISLNWIHENLLFDQFRLELKNCHLKPSSLYHLLFTLEALWNTAYSELTGESITLPAAFYSWNEAEEWLMHIYEKANCFHTSSKYSGTVIKNIMNVKAYIDIHYASPIDANEAAQNAQMSYSYFSRCFHDIVGSSFSDYCILVRIEQAKKLLLTTDRTIQQIAFDVGYNDEKYFSRLFKKTTGQNPSAFRKS